MRVTALSLRNYRNYSDAQLVCAPGCTLIVGANGQGKTNLVESLVFLASQSSHRSSSQQLLVRRDCEQAVIRTTVEANNRAIELDVEINRSKSNRAQVNGNTAKLKDFPSYISVVLFSPEHLGLVQGDPAGRRAYIDDLIAQLSPRMAGVFIDFDRVVKQRNTLLKSIGPKNLKQVDWSTLEIWDDKFIELATQIAQARERLTQFLSEPLVAKYSVLAQSDHEPRVHIQYDSLEFETTGGFSAEKYREALAQFLITNRSRESERGVTLAGPHRDDLFIGLHGLPAKGCASHGETWSLVIALNLASAGLIREQANHGDPILILDDVFSALDEQRRERLAAEISGFEQAFITGAVQSDVPSSLHARVLRVTAGTVEEL